MALPRSQAPHTNGGNGHAGDYDGDWAGSPLTSPHGNGSKHVGWNSAWSSSQSTRGLSKFNPQSQTRLGRLWVRLFGPGDIRKSLQNKWNSQVPAWRRGDRILPFLGRAMWKLRLLIVIVVTAIAFILLLSKLMVHVYRSVGFLGGGSKFVILLATNVGGGVMEWKGAKDWAIEKDSIANKVAYARRWGYNIELIDMMTKKRYAHEWRESWEKIDTLQDAMRKYPRAEWFWWMDLNTFIMEPTYSLQSHIFSNLNANTYRDINLYNPLNITHPPTDPYLDPEALSPSGDGNPNSINLIVPQDCGGFNLGSFFVRRSAWTDRLLDIWWDPVAYEQKHMEWEHKEQDALEWIYRNQPWVRSHAAFIPQRKINSFPLGACGENGNDPRIHYNPHDRDFVVNMAGCQWGRDCWAEMFEFKKLSARLNRGALRKLWDRIWSSESRSGVSSQAALEQRRRS